MDSVIAVPMPIGCLAVGGDLPWWVFAGAALILLLIAVVLFPYWLLARLPLAILSRIFYRITVDGLENVPAKGPALLVSNHVSHIDSGLIQACVRRPIRFMIWAEFLHVWWLYPLLRLVRAIPVKGTGGPRAIVRSLRNASEALAEGELVGIFAEGGISRTGFLLPFQRGLERIVQCNPAPIIPVCLDHVWGSIFSFRGGRFFWKMPKQFPYPLRITFGKPLPVQTPAREVRDAIQLLGAESFVRRAGERVPVHRQFVRVACKRPFQWCFYDPMNDKKSHIRYCEALVGAKIVARRLAPVLKEEEIVGVWIPPSPGGAIVNIALALLGKVVVNLNYTASPSLIQSTIRQCGIRHVLTSRLFTRKIALDAGPDAEVVYLDDMRKQITKWERVRGFLSVLLIPRFIQERWILKLGGHKSTDLLTVIFSSGSTGEPKGIMLTHDNIASNAESVIQAVDPSTKDRLLGILPFFHSFGYTVTLWVPLQVGASTVFHPNPLASKEIGAACRKFEATLFLATPTFLRSYLKRCEPDDFKSLRVIVCGAEKLPQSLAEEFYEKFGVRPLEGYGCTELSPVAAANVPDFEIDGYKQRFQKAGTIGRPLPGVAVKIVDPETLEDRPTGEEGMLLVYGANVMKGYLHRDDLTEKKMHNGWYITGDLATIDPDGFITITGRQERFAKVGGEMVPLEKVEDEIHQVLETNERICAVTAISDDKRGERLVVLHLNLDGCSAEQICQKLGTRGLPNIYIPGRRDFHEVDEIPILGSGKLDINQCKHTAERLARK